MAKRRCQECGELYERSFRRCPVCGAEGGRLIPRCPQCGSRLPNAYTRRCPVCGAALAHFGWARTLAKIALALMAALLLGATYIFAYVPRLGLPEPSWPTPTATITSTPTATATIATPTRTRTSTPTRLPPTSTPTAVVTYIVVAGDSLGLIAEKLGVSLEALMMANNLTDYMIHPDQVLIVPQGTPTPRGQKTPTVPPAAPLTRIAIPTSTPKP